MYFGHSSIKFVRTFTLAAWKSKEGLCTLLLNWWTRDFRAFLLQHPRWQPPVWAVHLWKPSSYSTNLSIQHCRLSASPHSQWPKYSSTSLKWMAQQLLILISKSIREDVKAFLQYIQCTTWMCKAAIIHYVLPVTISSLASSYCSPLRNGGMLIQMPDGIKLSTASILSQP